ncbi:MAG: hypothetical protein IKR03_02870 [Clostridia bacterium]|nr:hypothetical protein [Clostridia bacterium]
MRQVFLAKEYADRGLCTEGLQALIDEAAKVGGQVRFEAGTYETATLYMKSGVSLYLDAGAVIKGTADYTRYSNTFPKLEHLNEVTGAPRWHDALIYCQDCDNISIEGHGTIDGADVYNPGGEQQFRGPIMMLFYKCSNVSIKGVTLVRAANYATFFESCTDVFIYKVRAFAGQDAVEIYYCERVEISECDFRTGDDCVSGCFDRDVYIHDSKFNTPGGNMILLGCRHLRMNRCKIWSQGESPAVFKDKKRYSNGEGGINTLHWNADPEIIMSDDWVIEDIEFENVECVFRFNRNNFFQNGRVGKIVMRNCTAKNFVYPITVEGFVPNEFDLTIEDCRFVRAPFDKREDRSFIRANWFKSITLKNIIIENVSDDPFHFANGEKVTMTDVYLSRKAESADFSNVSETSIIRNPEETDAPFYVYDDVASIYVPNEKDETFIGARKYIG